MIMTITIFRHAHFPEELNEKFEHLLEKSDILVVEMATREFREEVKEHLNQLSQKGYSSFKFQGLFSEIQRKREDLIRDSKKQIELEESSISLKEFRKLENLIQDSREAFVNGDFEEAYNKQLDSAINIVRWDRKRDASLLNQLTKLQRENENKEILVPLGAGGHLIYYELKEKGLDTKQEFPYIPYTFPLFDEPMRRLRFGRPYTPQLIAQALVDRMVCIYLTNSGLSLHQAVEKSREIVEKLSYSEIRNLSKYISENNLRREMPKETAVLWLRKKGFEI